MERDAFYRRVREAAAIGRNFPVALSPEATAERSYVGGGDDPVETFLREWQAVGGFGDRVQNWAEAFEYLHEVINKHEVRQAITWKHPFLETGGVRTTLHAWGIRVDQWDELAGLTEGERRELTFGAQLGITSVDWAIAETGSLAVGAWAGTQGRSVSLLPPVHIAFLSPSQILPDLFDLFKVLEPRKNDLPSNLTLITGPSKTGDIQLQLTTGVHGPGEVHAVVVERAS